jgi:hypothetical protein
LLRALTNKRKRPLLRPVYIFLYGCSAFHYFSRPRCPIRYRPSLRSRLHSLTQLTGWTLMLVSMHCSGISKEIKACCMISQPGPILFQFYHNLFLASWTTSSFLSVLTLKVMGTGHMRVLARARITYVVVMWCLSIVNKIIAGKAILFFSLPLPIPSWYPRSC